MRLRPAAKKVGCVRKRHRRVVCTHLLYGGRREDTMDNGNVYASFFEDHSLLLLLCQSFFSEWTLSPCPPVSFEGWGGRVEFLKRVDYLDLQRTNEFFHSFAHLFCRRGVTPTLCRKPKISV
jgi:hypothetical protein